MTYGKHKTWVAGDKITSTELNYLLDFKTYATIALANTAAATWGAAEAGRIVYVSGTSIYYYWNGTAFAAFATSTTTVYKGTATGSSPITVAHGVGSTPAVVVLTANAAQPYALGYSADATNITIYHEAAGNLTVSWIAYA